MRIEPLAGRTPIVKTIKKMKTVDEVRKEYGNLGVDIFENKPKISILQPKDNTPIKRAINSIKGFLGIGTTKADYEPKDSIKDVMMKYFYNEKIATQKEISEKFGKKGMDCVIEMECMGYLRH